MSLGTESISAITFFTGDMASSTSFYEALGFRVLFGGPTAPFTSLGGLPVDDDPTHFVNLQLEPGFRQAGLWGRVIFHTPDLAGVDATHDAAVAAGYRPEAPPADAPWGERYFHIRDPSGHELSFACRLAGH